MIIGTGTIVAGMVCAAFAGMTAAAAVKGQRASQRKKHLSQILKQIGDGEQVCGEIVQVHMDDETLGAPCSYDISFLGTDGLSRKIALPMRLDMDNRYELGTPMLLRMSPVPIEPTLRPLNAPEQRYTRTPDITVQQHPTDETGRVLLENDYFALRDFLAAEKKRCSRAIVKYGLAAAFAGLDLFGLMIFFLYLLML